MSVRGLDKKSILELAKDFVRTQKEYHRIADATWENPRRLFRRRRKEVRFRHEIDLLSGELLARYEGVMRQMYRRAAPHPTALTNDEWQRIFNAAWLIVQDRAVVLHGYQGFFGILWSAYIGRMRNRAAVLPCKPKFMLLPFVDDMPEGDERNVLLAAYDDGLTVHATGKNLARLIGDSFPVLHGRLLSFATDLEVLTDGLTYGNEVKSMSAPFDQLRRWLFHI